MCFKIKIINSPKSRSEMGKAREIQMFQDGVAMTIPGIKLPFRILFSRETAYPLGHLANPLAAVPAPSYNNGNNPIIGLIYPTKRNDMFYAHANGGIVFIPPQDVIEFQIECIACVALAWVQTQISQQHPRRQTPTSRQSEAIVGCMHADFTVLRMSMATTSQCVRGKTRHQNKKDAH